MRRGFAKIDGDFSVGRQLKKSAFLSALFCLLFVAVIAVKYRKQRDIEHEYHGQDAVFQNLNKRYGRAGIVDDEVCDQADDDDQIRKQDQACGNVGAGLRFSAVFSVSAQIKEEEYAEHHKGSDERQHDVGGV